jgi:hypothetical protein
MATVDPQSHHPLADRGGEPAAIRAWPRIYPALAIGLIAGGLIVYLLSGTGSGSRISATISYLWDTLIAITIGLGILYGT